MIGKLRSWWEQIQKYQRTIGIVAVVLIVVVVITLVIAIILSNGTGLNGYNKVSTAHTISGPSSGTITRTEEYQPGKTLWDLLQLLIVPIILAVGGFWLNQIQKSREEHTAGKRAEIERMAAEQRAKTDHEIAADNQQEVALQAYIDRISELLLEKKLRESDANAEVRKIARVRTLTVLPRLDQARKRSLLQFLYESDLITKGKSIIDFSSADLSGIDLSDAHLNGVDLRKANLSGALLHHTVLEDADLSGANLSNADMLCARLSNANLRLADMSGVTLTGASLRHTDLTQAKLTHSKLDGAIAWDETIRMSEESTVDFFTGRIDLSGSSRERVFFGADLTEAIMERVDLRHATLRYALLHKANLKGAYLDNVDLDSTDLSGANLTGIHAPNSQDLATRLKLARLEGATMPDGSIHPGW